MLPFEWGMQGTEAGLGKLTAYNQAMIKLITSVSRSLTRQLIPAARAGQLRTRDLIPELATVVVLVGPMSKRTSKV